MAKGYGEVEIDQASRLSKRTQQNRRVDFRIIDPQQMQTTPGEPGSLAKEPKGKKAKRDKSRSRHQKDRKAKSREE